MFITNKRESAKSLIIQQEVKKKTDIKWNIYKLHFKLHTRNLAKLAQFPNSSKNNTRFVFLFKIQFLELPSIKLTFKPVDHPLTKVILHINHGVKLKISGGFFKINLIFA